MDIGLSFMMMMLFALSGGSELLSLVPTEAYWQAKQVEPSAAVLIEDLRISDQTDPRPLIEQLGDKESATRDLAAQRLRLIGAAAAEQLEQARDSRDAEVAMRAQDLLDELRERPKTASIRRLMTIRTLGEMKSAEALPVLREMLVSEEMFVAEYARRAIAMIEDTPPAKDAPELAAQRQADLKLLPEDCGVVAQIYPAPPPTARVQNLLSLIAPADQEDPDHAPTMIQDMAEMLIEQAETIGNIRFDGATIGVADDIGDTSGFVVFILRGLYDAESVRLALERNDDAETTIVEHEGQPVHYIDETVAMIVVSDEQLIFSAAAQASMLPAEEMAASLAVPPDAPRISDEITELVASIDTSKPLWVAIRVSDAYRHAPVLQMFDAITIEGTHAENGLDLSAEGRGPDPQQVADAVESLKGYLEWTLREMREMAEHSPMFGSFIEFFESIEVEAEGEVARGTAKLKQSTLMPIIGEIN
jgi:hypothetical protein